MTKQHPIAPPPELRRLWAQQAQRMDPHDPVAWMQHVSTQAAQWGADQELEACCEWVSIQLNCTDQEHLVPYLRVARRPKPPSLKEQALERCNDYIDPDGINSNTAEQPLIRQLQLHPSLYCLMATNEQAAIMINVIADAIEYEGLSGTTANWLRTQAGETK